MEGQASCLAPSSPSLRNIRQTISFKPIHGEPLNLGPQAASLPFEQFGGGPCPPSQRGTGGQCPPLNDRKTIYGQFTIFSNVKRHLTPVCSDTPSKIWQHANYSAFGIKSVAGVSGETSKQWQKN